MNGWGVTDGVTGARTELTLKDDGAIAAEEPGSDTERDDVAAVANAAAPASLPREEANAAARRGSSKPRKISCTETGMVSNFRKALRDNCLRPFIVADSPLEYNTEPSTPVTVTRVARAAVPGDPADAPAVAALSTAVTVVAVQPVLESTCSDIDAATTVSNNAELGVVVNVRDREPDDVGVVLRIGEAVDDTLADIVRVILLDKD